MMWQKIKCWFGWHNFEINCLQGYDLWEGGCIRSAMDCDAPLNKPCEHMIKVCKHCGKVKI